MMLESMLLFFLAAFLEIGGGYLVWLWLREGKSAYVGLIGAAVLFLYGAVPTLQTQVFSKVYAAYGGIFVVSSIIWGRAVDKRSPDRYEIFGALVILLGVFIIYYTPR